MLITLSDDKKGKIDMAEFTINKGLNPKGQAALIVKAGGLAFVKPRFFDSLDSEVMVLQDQAREEGRDGIASGYFGLPIFDVLTMEGFSYTTLEGNNITVDTLKLGVALCDVTQSKNIVTTAIQGRNGTIKEYISDGDYQINIKGVVATVAQDYYPDDDVRFLKAFLDAPVSFKVASTYLNRLGIYDVVVNNYTLNQSEGMRNVQYFDINCFSEKPFELQSQSEIITQ
jgi:hypothetical protein